MNILKQSFLALMAVAVMGLFSVDAVAQDKRTAVQTYNKAQELAKNKSYEEAVDTFEEAISISEKLGAEGEDIVKRSKDKLPGVYFDMALQEYQTYKSSPSLSQIDAAIAAFQTASEMGQKYGNSSVADKAAGVVPKLKYGKSSLQYKQGNNQAALTTIDEVIESNPEYATAYYQKALIVKKTDSFDAMISMLEKAIDAAEQSGNSNIARKSEDKITEELISRGGTYVNDKDYSNAIETLQSALEYNPESADANFWLAKAYNSRGSWDQGLNYAQKAIDLENGGRTSKAKIHFEIATAYKGKGDYGNACNHFSNASYGQFKQSAQHQMEYVLKCDSKTR